VRDSILVHPLNEGAFVAVTFSLPLNGGSVEVSVQSNGWRVELVLRSAGRFSGEIFKNHFRVTGSVFKAFVHGVVKITKVHETDLFLSSLSLEFSAGYVLGNSVSIFKYPVDNTSVFESASIVHLLTLMEPLLFGEVVNVKALGELRVSGSVDLSDEHLLVHIFQRLSSLFVLRVRLVCVEVNEHELMIF